MHAAIRTQLVHDRPKPIGDAIRGEIVAYIAKKQQIEQQTSLNRRWYGVQVLVGREAKVSKRIRELGFGVYYPIEIAIRQLRPGLLSMKVIRQMYPGYVFVQFDSSEPGWAAIKEIDGAIMVLSIDGWPVEIGDAVMARVREVERIKLRGDPVVVPMEVAVGNVVRVIDYWAFSGLFGEVAEVDSAGRRVRINLRLAGGEAPLWLGDGQWEVV